MLCRHRRPAPSPRASPARQLAISHPCFLVRQRVTSAIASFNRLRLFQSCESLTKPSLPVVNLVDVTRKVGLQPLRYVEDCREVTKRMSCPPSQFNTTAKAGTCIRMTSARVPSSVPEKGMRTTFQLSGFYFTTMLCIRRENHSFGEEDCRLANCCQGTCRPSIRFSLCCSCSCTIIAGFSIDF